MSKSAWSSLFTYIFYLTCISSTFIRPTLPYKHPDPQAIVQQLQSKVSASIASRRRILETNLLYTQSKDQTPCQTGNPIDDCWRCDPNWANDRQHLADCGIGFGQGATGGKGGKIYIVTDPSDSNPENPPLGTLRHAVIQSEPLWIIFANDMHINLQTELIVSSSKTIDGRGAIVHVTGKGCLAIENVENIIIHGLYIHDCKPSGDAKIRISPTDVVHRGKSDGDAMTIKGARNVWIDHCSFARCADGLVDITLGSTAITVTNSYFTNHDKVMLLGHSDDYLGDADMQVTIAFNHFGKGLVERMPRCRHGYFHVVNNDYTEWQLYAIGGSAAPTINSQGNRFVAQPGSKEVTKRMDTNKNEWTRWNWRSEGDLMVNGAFFVSSGSNINVQYTKASSVPAMSANLMEQLTMHAGVLVGVPSNSPPGGNQYTITPGCYEPGDAVCIPYNLGGGDPFGAPPQVLQGCGPGTIPYCGDPGSSGASSTMARSSILTIILVSSLVVLALYSKLVKEKMA